MGSLSVKKNVIRGAFFLLAIVPLIFFRDFYEHFYVYLTGTIIADVIKNEWHIVLVSIAVSLAFFFLLSFRRKVKWAEYGIVSAFFISLFVEMYGMPLTIIFASKYFLRPGLKAPENILEFNLLGVGFGADIVMAYGLVLITIGMMLIFAGWITLYGQAKKNHPAFGGIYSLSRHPQYFGFILFVIGWFFGWPTLLTLFFAPVLVYKYIILCKQEELEVEREFPEYEEYKREVPFLL